MISPFNLSNLGKILAWINFPKLKYCWDVVYIKLIIMEIELLKSCHMRSTDRKCSFRDSKKVLVVWGSVSEAWLNRQKTVKSCTFDLLNFLHRKQFPCLLSVLFFSHEHIEILLSHLKLHSFAFLWFSLSCYPIWLQGDFHYLRYSSL